MKLNLGCGKDYRDGYVNVDNDLRFKSDMNFDLNVYPYPFDDCVFDKILVFHILEHLDDPYGFMVECYRLLKCDGVIVVKLPVGSFGYAHHSIIHCKDYFKDLTRFNDKFGQTGKYFSLCYQKRSLRNPLGLYYRFRNWFLNLFSDEWEYCLKKEDG